MTSIGLLSPCKGRCRVRVSFHSGYHRVWGLTQAAQESIMRFLAQRHREPEIMDDPRLDQARHQAALRGLARINWFSGSSRILWPSLRDLARKLAPRPLRVLDLATGSGDVPRRLWQKAPQAGLPMEIDG